MKKLILAMLLSVAALPAMAAGTPTSITTAISNLIAKGQHITVTDLQAALADASAQTPPDTRHGACWQALIPFAQSGVANPLPAGLGLAQLVQKGFDLNTTLGKNLIPDAVVTPCALTVSDLNLDFVKLMAVVGVKITAPLIPLP